MDGEIAEAQRGDTVAMPAGRRATATAGHTMITNATGATTSPPMSVDYKPKTPNTLGIKGVGISGTYVRP